MLGSSTEETRRCGKSSDLGRRPGARAKSLRVGQLIFRHDTLDIPGFAPDAISETTVGFDGHALNDGINHGLISFGSTLRPLAEVLNVFIQLVGV